MYPTLLNKTIFSLINQVAGVSVTLNRNGECRIDLVLIGKKRDNLFIIKKNKNIKSFKQLGKELVRGTPIILCLEGKGIIHKKYSREENSQKQIANNFSENDFYIQKTYNKDILFVSVMRKAYLEKIIQDVKLIDLIIIDLYLGPFSIKNIIPILINNSKGKESKIKTRSYTIILKNKEIFDLQRIDDYEGEKYNISGKQLESIYIVPYSAAISIFLYQNIPFTSSKTVINQRNDFYYKLLTRIFGWTFLIIVFILLSVNSVLYYKYNSRLQQYQIKYQTNNKLINLLDQKKREIDRKNNFISQNIDSTKIFYSFYFDRIGSLISSGIRLDKLTFNPPLENIRNNKLPEFKKNLIYIKGETINSDVLYKWIDKLKNEKWTKSISVKNFAQESRYTYGVFILMIELQ